MKVTMEEHQQASEMTRAQIDINKEKIKKLKENVKTSMAHQIFSRRDLEQVEKDIGILAMEERRLILAVKAKAKQQKCRPGNEGVPGTNCRGVLSTGTNVDYTSRKRKSDPLCASRRAVPLNSMEHGSKSNKKSKHMPTTANHLALNCSSATLTADLREARAQTSQLQQRRNELSATLIAEEAICHQLETELEKLSALSAKLEESLKPKTTTTNQTLIDIQKEIDKLKELIHSLQVKYKESISLARAYTKEDLDSPSKEEEDKVRLPPVQGTALPNKDVAYLEGDIPTRGDMKQPVIPVEDDKDTIELVTRSIEETVTQIDRLEANERRCFEVFLDWKSRLSRAAEEMDSSFRKFLFLYHIPGGYLDFDHANEQLQVRNVPETKATYR